jgi:hypothetical protein
MVPGLDGNNFSSLLHLNELFNQFISSLQGCAPHNQNDQDICGWVLLFIQLKKDFILSESSHGHPRAGWWNKFWHNDGIPKINFFCWLLVHKNIPTTKNMQKGGINGPSWCVLCQEAEESIQHIFIDCKFTK